MTFVRRFIFNFLLPLGILFGFLFLGNVLNRYLFKFMPGPVIGMLLLLLALSLNIVPYSLIEDFSLFLVRHISFFIIPTNLSLMVILPRIGDSLVRVMLMLVCSLISVMILTASFAGFFSRLLAGGRGVSDE